MNKTPKPFENSQFFKYSTNILTSTSIDGSKVARKNELVKKIVFGMLQEDEINNVEKYLMK